MDVKQSVTIEALGDDLRMQVGDFLNTKVFELGISSNADRDTVIGSIVGDIQQEALQIISDYYSVLGGELELEINENDLYELYLEYSI